MTITLEQVGKRYGRDWIFRKLSCRFEPGHTYAILGPNGSGKSTLIQLIACNQTPTEGSVTFSNGTAKIETEDVFQSLSLCAPYMQLIEEFTLEEQLRFHFNFKTALDGMKAESMIELMGLGKHARKQIRYFSSGMKQRVKLCLAMLTDVPVVLLDEPATNLDESGMQWYKQLLENYTKNRILIVSSNRNEEYEMCGARIFLTDYKI